MPPASLSLDAVGAVARADTTCTPSVAANGVTEVTPLDAVFSDPPRTATATASKDTASKDTKKRNSGSAMFGLVPKSGFLVNQQKLFEGNGKINDTNVAAAIKKRRETVLWHFSRVGKTRTKERGDDPGGPITRSSLADDSDWAVDMDGVNYAFEHIVTLSTKTAMLLFVLDDEANLRRHNALRVESVVGSNRTQISGREYIRLPITLDDVHHNELLTGKSVVGGGIFRGTIHV